jgi:hypothetical protein
MPYEAGGFWRGVFVALWSAVALGAAACASQPDANQSAEGASETAAAAFDPRDFNGIWQGATQDLTANLLPGEEIVLTEYGAQRYRSVDHAKFPGNTCLPYGPNRGMAATNPYMIVQTPDTIAVLTEHIDYRVFYMNEKAHPEDILEYPEWMGHSIGRWEGDELVVDTVAIREESWLDRGGLEHSDKLHLVERFKKTSKDSFTWTVTVEDPVFFAKPWTYQLKVDRLDFPRLIPDRCDDNEVDAAHMLPTPGAIHKVTPTMPRS